MVGRPGMVKWSLCKLSGPAAAFFLILPILSPTSSAVIGGKISDRDSLGTLVTGPGTYVEPTCPHSFSYSPLTSSDPGGCLAGS